MGERRREAEAEAAAHKAEAEAEAHAKEIREGEDPIEYAARIQQEKKAREDARKEAAREAKRKFLEEVAAREAEESDYEEVRETDCCAEWWREMTQSSQSKKSPSLNSEAYAIKIRQKGRTEEPKKKKKVKRRKKKKKRRRGRPWGTTTSPESLAEYERMGGHS